MPDLKLDQIDYSDPNNFAINYIRADKATRKELLRKLKELNPKKVFLLIKTRKIAKRLKEKNASFAILSEYENYLAQTLRPKRKGHLGAQFFSGRHYEKRVRPYLAEIDDLKNKSNLTSTTLMPVIARMTNEDGRELAVEYFNQIHGRIKEICAPLEVIESALEGIKKGIINKPTNRADYKKKWEIVKKYFDAVYKKDLGLIFIKRAELDGTVKIYSKALWKYYQFLKNRSKKPGIQRPFSTRTNVISSKEKSRLEEDITDDDITISQPQITRIPAKSYDRKEINTEVIPRGSSPPELEQPDSDVIKIGDILIPKIGEVFKSLPNTQIRNAWLDLIKGEKVITGEEREKIDLKTEDILDVEAIISSDQENEEHKKQKEKYTSCLISNLENKDSISAKMEVVVKFKNSSSNSIINDVHTIYEILLKREKKIKIERAAAEITEEETRKISDDGLEDTDTVSSLTQEAGEELQDVNISDNGLENIDSASYEDQGTLEEQEDKDGMIAGQGPGSDDNDLAGLFKGLEYEEEPDAPGTLEEVETEIEATLSAIEELDIMSAEADSDSDIDTDEICITTDLDDLITPDEEITGNNKSTELININEIIAKIFSSIDDDENFKELGQAFGGSKYLSPSEIVDEITKQAGTIEDEPARNKIQEILEASQKILEEIEPLPSDVRKITRLNFWINDDYTDKPHMQKFLEGQIIEHENNKGSKEQLLSNLFRELKKFDDPEGKIRYLNEKHDDPAYRHLKSTIQTIIENIQKKVDLEPENISKEWIDSELAGSGDPDARLNWLTIRRYLPSYSDLADHIDMKTAEIEETLEEDTFTECVKASLDKKEREGKKPAVYNNIISLTRAVLKLQGPGKRQIFIKEQEVLAPYDDGSNNLFKKQRKLIFYLMSTASNEGNIRLKVLADRVSMPFKEKQEYLKILKLSKYKDKAGNSVTLQEELNITDENIAYYAVYILGFNRPLEERIRYIENFRDEHTNDSYAKYKESFDITTPLINKVISELKKKLPEKITVTESETQKGTETLKERHSELSEISSRVDELFEQGVADSSPSVCPVEVLKRIRRKQEYYEELRNRIKKHGKEKSKEKATVSSLTENIESISSEYKNDPEDKKPKNMLNKILVQLSNCDADAVGDIVEGTILPSLSKTGDSEVKAMLKNINQNVFIPALNGENVDIKQIKEFFSLTDENIENIEKILENINKMWHEEIKNEIKTEEKKIESFERAAATGGITGIITCLLEADPGRVINVIKNDFLARVDPTLDSIINKLETLKGILNGALKGKTNLKGVDKYFGEDAELVKKLVKKVSEYSKEKKEKEFKGDAGIKADNKTDLLSKDGTQNITEEKIYDKAEISDKIKNALMGASGFIKPHLAITKAADDEEYSGEHNREKRQNIIDHLHKSGKIFTYDGGTTYIGWGKIIGFVKSQTYKEMSAREKKRFSDKLNAFLKRFKNNNEKYGFTGIENDSETKMENVFKLLMKKIGGGVAKKHKKPSPDKKLAKMAIRPDVRPKKAKKSVERKDIKIKKAKRKELKPKERKSKESKSKALEPKDPKAAFLETLDKSTKTILKTANSRITKKLIQVIDNTQDPLELVNYSNLYLKPNNQENLLKLLDIFNLINKKLIDAIRKNKALYNGLSFDKKKVMKLYEKQKKNIEKNRSKNKVA